MFLIRDLSVILFFLSFSFVSAPVGAQEKDNGPSQEELEKYVDIQLDVRDIRRERSNEVIDAIESSSLDVQRFRTISTMQGKEEAEISEEEQKAFDQVQEEIKGIQEEYRNKEKDRIEEMGMDIARYREIGSLKGKDKEVRERLIRIQKKKRDQAQEKE